MPFNTTRIPIDGRAMRVGVGAVCIFVLRDLPKAITPVAGIRSELANCQSSAEWGLSCFGHLKVVVRGREDEWRRRRHLNLIKYKRITIRVCTSS